MNSQHVITVLIQHICAWPSGALGCVWLFNGDGRPSLDAPEPIEQLAGWMKIVGPIEDEAAGQLQDALKRFFERSGFIVISDAISDD